MKPKISRRKEITNNREELNKIETKNRNKNIDAMFLDLVLFQIQIEIEII